MSGSGEQFTDLPSGITLCFETFGSPEAPPVLLVMGLGGPMNWWDTSFCERLADEGLFVIRFDNRDTGRSTHLREHRVGRPDIVKAAVGLVRHPPYRLDDLAEDAFGLLDHLGLEAAHLVGVSMGGMIVQTMAIARPERALSLTSIMSTTGRRTVGFQNPRVLPGLFLSNGEGREGYVSRQLRGTPLISSPDYPTAEAAVRARAEETYDRGWSPDGVVRQLLAILTQPDRTKALGRLRVPVTVVHGTKDPLVHRSGGKATAAAIPGAEHVEIPGMAHDLPEPLHGRIVEIIASTVARASARR